MMGDMAPRMRFNVVNLGCKVNRVESDAFEAQLRRLGMEPSSPESADVIVVNTCTVTSVAEKKTRKEVRRAVRANEGASVVVTGCAAMQSPGLFESMSSRVSVVPKWEMGEFLEHMRPSSQYGPVLAKPGKARMGVKVQDGCDNECTYCIVHTLRGPERSVNPSRVISDASALARAGVREIVLTGINLGRYRHEEAGLARLLEELLSHDFSCRYRLSSIEPDNLSDDVIRLVSASDGRICRHFHLPLQSGCTKVLREMGRRYDAGQFSRIVGKIRDAAPTASVTTDVICGFPGETDAEFEETCDFCKEMRFSKIHVFPYSEREGTPAAARTDQVHRNVRIERAAKLRAIADELRRNDLESRAGSIESAVVEGGQDCLTESYHWVDAPEGSVDGDLVDVAL